MSAQEISEALAKKRAQKKTLLDAYSQKYGTKKQAENENERDKFLAKARRLKRQKEEQVPYFDRLSPLTFCVGRG